MFQSALPPINVSDWEPWQSPTFIPGAPHNLPSRPAETSVQTPTAPAADVREAHRYASLITVSLTVGTTSFKFLDQPIGKRNMLGFRNASSTQNLFIDFNGQASTSSWLRLAPGAIVLFDTVVPQDDLYVVADGAGATLAYAYSTFSG